MKINELINAVTKDYIPIKKKMMEAQREGLTLSVTDEQTYFELNTTLELYKVIKGVFMEEATKNKNMINDLIKKGILHTKINQAEKDGKKVDVEVIVESMDFRIDNVPEDIQKGILEKMVKSHKENVEKNYKNNPELLRKEAFELYVLEQFLPKEATKEDIMNYINEYYPNGIEQKSMGKVIGEVKKAFERADGKLIAECVKSKLA